MILSEQEKWTEITSLAFDEILAGWDIDFKGIRAFESEAAKDFVTLFLPILKDHSDDKKNAAISLIIGPFLLSRLDKWRLSHPLKIKQAKKELS